ncbi:hypothetical protein HD553DRAFT_192468 [Filobasidium floriforme]|uniref:uncharacterized protein n=1 Tax=Filobasidium floriforme TaxID=5210 RepID=UPI001E8D5721|nr:uncharacterized protein HD553DRAFT_192468 [Filobasidium floriforme]KAH8088233.1 hypothetical protein HD553DRAFT_192468 [Filobasidium floriforme]
MSQQEIGSQQASPDPLIQPNTTDALTPTKSNTNTTNPNTNTNTNTNTPTTRRKKRTKTSIACEACQTRKSRCELVTAKGCHRCAVLGTACSLVGSGRASTSTSTSTDLRNGYGLLAYNSNDELRSQHHAQRDPSRIPGYGPQASGSRESRSSIIDKYDGITSFPGNPHLNHNLNSHLKRARSSTGKEGSSDRDQDQDRDRDQDQQQDQDQNYEPDQDQDRGRGRDGRRDLREIKRRTIDIQNMLKTILSSQPHSQFQNQNQIRDQGSSGLALASTSASALEPALPLSFVPSSLAIPNTYSSITSTSTSTRPPTTTTSTNTTTHQTQHHNHNHHTEESDLYGKTHPETGGPIGSSFLALGLASQPVYLDPIELGVVLPREMERVYQVFVELFPCALPLHRLIRSPRQPPKHPLLRSAILYFLACTSNSNSVSSPASISTSSFSTPRPSSLISFSPMTRRMIIKMLEQNLSLITQNNNTRPEIASIESLLIVSLSPPHSNSYNPEGTNNGKSNPNLGLSIAIEPYNAGALALDLAKRLGLDDSMRVVVRERDGSGLDQWDTTGSLNRLCLWFSCLHRQTWLNLLGGSGSMLDYISLSSIPTALSERYHVNAWYFHLKFESRLLDLVFPVVRQIQVVRTGEMWDPVAMQELHDRFVVFKAECEVWRRDLLSPGLPSQPSLCLLSHIVEVALASRIRADSGAFIYPPIHPDIAFPHLKRYGGHIFFTGKNIIRHVAQTRPDLSSMPAYLSTFVLFAYAAVYQVKINDSQGEMDVLSADLAVAESLLREVYCFNPSIVDRVQQPIAASLRWREVLEHLGPDGTPKDTAALGMDTFQPMDFEGLPFQLDPDWLAFFSMEADFGEGAIDAAFASA